MPSHQCTNGRKRVLIISCFDWFSGFWLQLISKRIILRGLARLDNTCGLDCAVGLVTCMVIIYLTNIVITKPYSQLATVGVVLLPRDGFGGGVGGDRRITRPTIKSAADDDAAELGSAPDAIVVVVCLVVVSTMSYDPLYVEMDETTVVPRCCG